MIDIFEKLMSLPLFYGVTRARLSEIVGEYKFHFLKFQRGETIVSNGEEFTHITFVLSGSVRMRLECMNDLILGQSLVAPAVVAPDYLFGKVTRCIGDVVAQTNCSILKISKEEYMRILCTDQVFLMNYLNMLSANAQRAQLGLLAMRTDSLETRLAYLVVTLTQPTSRAIVLSSNHEEGLLISLGIQDEDYGRNVNNLEEQGIIRYSDARVEILDRQALVKLLQL